MPTDKRPPRVVSAKDAHFFELIKAYRAMKKCPAREHLFARMHHLQHKNLEHYAYKFRSPRIPLDPEDAMQGALLGFLRAIDSWDPAKGSWITHLFWSCRKGVEIVQGKEPVVYRPSGCGMPYKIHRAQEAFYARTGRDADAADLGVTPEQLAKWRAQETFQRVDFDAPTETRSEEVPMRLVGGGKRFSYAPSDFTPEKP